MKAISFALSAALLIAGCEAGFVDPANQNRNTAAAGGAAVGAIVGAIASDNQAGAVVAGAVAGSILGAGVGAALDRQAEELREELGEGVAVTNTGDSLLVTFPQDILFDVDSAVVPAARQSDLRVLADSLQDHRNTDVRIVGHTDSTGSNAYNFDLSTRRAGAVASVLVANGVAGNRITALGQGEEAPLVSNATASGRQQNRRVEVVIRPIT